MTTSRFSTGLFENDRTQTQMIAAVMGDVAKIAISQVTPLTDNGGGAAGNGTIDPIAIPAAFSLAAAGGAFATGTLTQAGQPSANDTVTINGTAVTFVASGATGNQVNIAGTAALTWAALLAFLQASADTQLAKFTYVLTSATVITATSKAQGTPGNAYTLAKSGTNLSVSGANFAGGTDTLVQKAAFEAQAVAVKDAISEIIAKLNTMRAKVQCFDALVDNTGGAAADGTIGAIANNLGVVATSFASATGTRQVCSDIRDRLKHVAGFVNLMAFATNYTQLIDTSGGATPPTTDPRQRLLDPTIPALSTSTGTATTGTNGTTDAGIKAADANTFLAACRDEIKELSTAIAGMISSGASGSLVPAAVAIP